MTSINDKPLMFPTHHNLVLDTAERAALDSLYELDPYLDGPEELLHQALRAGIRVLNELTGSRRDPHEPTRTSVEAAKKSIARQNDSSIFPKPHYHLESYVGIPLETRLRIKLEDFLAENQGVVSDEQALQMLLDLGLRCAIGENPTQVIERVKKDARRRRMLGLARPL